MTLLKLFLHQISRYNVILVLIGLVATGVLNFAVLKMMYATYGDVNGHNFSFFANQGTNFLYIVLGGVVLYPRMLFTDLITPQMRRFPQRHFVRMAILDAFGTFLTSVGAPRTPGQLQPLLNQTLIPITMLFSYIVLRKQFDCWKISGAVLITGGAILSSLPQILHKAHDPTKSYSISIIFYALSNVPMACSAVYKERSFSKARLDVWYLTQWVSVYQFLVTFLLIPTMMLPIFGDAFHGMHSPNDVFDNIAGGMQCYLHRIPACAEHSAFWLLTGYTAINVLYNTLGLYVTKHGGAAFSAICYSLLLPLSTLIWFSPIVGSYEERFTAASWATVAAAGVTMSGFLCYQRSAITLESSTRSLASETHRRMWSKQKVGQSSFQERVVGMGVAHQLDYNSNALLSNEIQ